MQRFSTKGIILKRINYGESDRIITFLTPDRGIVSALTKGVRKPKSKLAGGIELFSVSEITILIGKGDLDHLISSRLVKHYEGIVGDYDRLQFGYELLKVLNKIGDSDPEDFFKLTEKIFEYLADIDIPLLIVQAWVWLKILDLTGHQPNVSTSSDGQKLEADRRYMFDVDDGVFTEASQGQFMANNIKTWRLLLNTETLPLGNISGFENALEPTLDSLERFVRQVGIL